MPRFLSFRCSVIVLALFAICGGSAPAAAQILGQNKVHYRSFDFQVLKTDHFDIYFYPRGAAGSTSPRGWPSAGACVSSAC